MDGRQIWSIINEVVDRKQCRHKMSDTFCHNGKPIKGEKDIANGFNEYFASIGTYMAESLPTEEGYEKYPNLTPDYSFSLARTTKEGVEKIMRNQKPKLSCGIDTIRIRSHITFRKINILFPRKTCQVSSSSKPSFSKAQCIRLVGSRFLHFSRLCVLIEYYCEHYLYSPCTYLGKIYNDLENSSHYTADNKARRENAHDDNNHQRRVGWKG